MNDGFDHLWAALDADSDQPPFCPWLWRETPLSRLAWLLLVGGLLVGLHVAGWI